MGISYDRILAQVRDLNAAFREKTLAPESFYAQLASHGVDVNDSVIAAYVPDSGSTVIGVIVTPDQKTIRFDLDLEDPSLSRMEELDERLPTVHPASQQSIDAAREIARNACEPTQVD